MAYSVPKGNQQDTGGSGWLDEYIKGYEQDPNYVAQGMALRVIEQALKIMDHKGMSRSDLATLMGVSRAYVTRTFNAPPNLTLRTIAQLGITLGAKPEVRFVAPSVNVERNTAMVVQEDQAFASSTALIPQAAGTALIDGALLSEILGATEETGWTYACLQQSSAAVRQPKEQFPIAA